MSEELRVTAAFVRELGSTSQIEVGELSTAGPGGNEVVVRVDEVCVNPVDTLVRSGAFATPVPLPLILGRDLVGTVERAPKFSRFRAGDRVWAATLGHDGRQGSFATRAVVPTSRLYTILDGVQPRSVVALAHPATTAALGWFEHAQLRAGQWVFIGGAAGNVGRAALQIAKWAGAMVIATASAADLDAVRELGADYALDYRAEDLAARVLDIAPRGVDAVWDTSGHMELAVSAQIVRVGGVVLLTAAGSGSAELPVARFYTRDVSLIGFVHSRATETQMARAAEVVNQGTEAGWLTPGNIDVLPLAQSREAHERLEAGRVRGRLVVEVSGNLQG